MKLSLNWIKDFVDLPAELDLKRLAYDLTMSTVEVEGMEELARRYDGIINFIHYRYAEEYKEIHPLLISNTDHLIFLSSYRVYADTQHPITESAPQLYKVLEDPEFFAR